MACKIMQEAPAEEIEEWTLDDSTWSDDSFGGGARGAQRGRGRAFRGRKTYKKTKRATTSKARATSSREGTTSSRGKATTSKARSATSTASSSQRKAAPAATSSGAAANRVLSRPVIKTLTNTNAKRPFLSNVRVSTLWAFKALSCKWYLIHLTLRLKLVLMKCLCCYSIKGKVEVEFCRRMIDR